MSINKDKSFIDVICFRCFKINPKHDIKYTIRKHSIFENVKIKLIVLYFIIYECFLINSSTKKTEIEVRAFCEKFTLDKPSQNNIAKLYNVLRRSIKIKMHKEWSKNLLGSEPSEGGVPHIEIDESKILGNENRIYWMFGMICRASKKCRIYCVLNNRTRDTLLPILKANVITINDLNEYENEEEIKKYSLCTRIYSDCWSSY